MIKILTFITGFIGVKGLKISILLFYYTAVFAFYYFLISSALNFYTLISNFLHYMQFNDSSDAVSKFLGLLNCIGFLDAFNASKPMLFSSLTFLFAKLGWRISLNLKKEIVDKALKLI